VVRNTKGQSDPFFSKSSAELPLDLWKRREVLEALTRQALQASRANAVTAYQCVGEKLPHYRGRPLGMSLTLGLSKKAVGQRAQ
jgi:hypothetical protein